MAIPSASDGRPSPAPYCRPMEISAAEKGTSPRPARSWHRRWDHPGLVVAATWLLGLSALVRLGTGPAPGATPADLALLALVPLWAIWMVCAQVARRRREAAVDEAIAMALAESRRPSRQGATIGRG